MRRRSTALWTSAALALALALAVAPLEAGIARADAAAEARFWDELARRAYARGRYAEALGLFLSAHGAAPAPRTLYNVALCASLSGDHSLAYASFAEYLATHEPHEGRRSDAERRLATLARGLALVRVESDPPGATIWIDRRELGAYGTTPRTVVLSPGAHTIELERTDRHGERVEVVAATGEIRIARASLAPRTGLARIDAPGAQVTLEREGESMVIAAGREERVPVGSWRARVSAPGMRETTVTIVVGEEGLEQRRVELEAIPAPVGRLLVRTHGVRARVTVDGEPRAETPARLEVRAGDHEVAIEAAGHVTWARRVAIAQGDTLRLDVTLVRE